MWRGAACYAAFCFPAAVLCCAVLCCAVRCWLGWLAQQRVGWWVCLALQPLMKTTLAVHRACMEELLERRQATQMESD